MQASPSVAAPGGGVGERQGNFTFVRASPRCSTVPAASDLPTNVGQYTRRFGSDRSATTTKPKTPPGAEKAARPAE